MLQPPQRSALTGPALIRLLARLTDADVPESGQPLSDRLSQWLSWTDAVTLSAALKVDPPVVAGAHGGDGDGDDDAQRLCAGVRASLTAAIAGARRGGAPSSARSQTATLDAAAVDYVDFRQRYLSLQQAMQTDIGDLRGRLRRRLATRTPELARLALLDASMEQALGPRERSLLAAVPALLETRFARLRDAGRQRLADSPAAGAAAAIASGAWLDVFRDDMRGVLLAELDLRFQPVDGLLAALRTC